MQDPKKQGRRSFFKTLAAFAGGSVLVMLLPKIEATAESRKKVGADSAGAALPLCEPGKGMAGGMNYHHSHADVKDAKLKTARGGVEWNQQFCDNCSFFTAAGATGKCSVIQGCSVKPKGWCSTWAKKA